MSARQGQNLTCFKAEGPYDALRYAGKRSSKDGYYALRTALHIALQDPRNAVDRKLCIRTLTVDRDQKTRN